MRITLYTLLFFSSICSQAQSVLSGKVTSTKGEVIPGANVYLQDTYDGASTDLNGEFSFKTDETDSQQLVVTFIGFKKKVLAVHLPVEGKIHIELEEEINRLDAVVISAGSFSASEENKREVLQPLDIVTTAGATADIAGALNTLPGTQTVGETGRLFVRGGDGYETRTFIDGMEVLDSYSPATPNTPTRARFSPFMFSGTSFSTGGYSAQYGEALSSALVLNTKDMPAQNRTDLSLMTVGTDVAHSHIFDHSSISAKVQYINMDPYFQLVKQQINYDQAPQSIDGNFAYRHELGEGMLKVYGNMSRSGFIIYQPQILDENMEDRIDLSNTYQHFNANYKAPINEKWSLKTGAAFTNSGEDIKLNEEGFNESTQGAHLKTVVGYDDTEKLSLTFGTEHFYRQSKFEVEKVGAHVFDYQQHLTASFVESDFYLSNNFVLRTGLRLEYDDLQNQAALFPRTSLSYRVGEKGQVSMAYGMFSQQARPDFLRVNNNLQAEQAQHFILNYQIIASKRTFRIEGYYKNYDDLIKFSDAFDAASFDNNGSGFARGFDIFWRDNQTFKGLDYWVSYSYLDTERDYRNFPSSAIPNFASAHNFSVVTKYFWQELKTQIGATYSFASQRPYNNPNTDNFNADRTPAYHDLSVNFSYLFRSNVIFHASVTNVLGIDNVFGYEYSQQTNAEGEFVGRAIKQPAPRFIFFGAFITLTKNKTTNQLPNL